MEVASHWQNSIADLLNLSGLVAYIKWEFNLIKPKRLNQSVLKKFLLS